MFVLFRGPGSGKGTQCAKMVDKYGLAHLSAGDLLREEVCKDKKILTIIMTFAKCVYFSLCIQRDSGSETAALINKCIVEGTIVPVEITCQLLKRGMEKLGWEKKRYLIDGFPRN